MQAQRPEKANGQRWRQRQQRLFLAVIEMHMMNCGSFEGHSSISSNESVAAAQSVSIASSPSPSALASISMSSVSQQNSITRPTPQSVMQRSEPARAQQVPAAEYNANKSNGRTNVLLNLFHNPDTSEDETETFQIHRKLLRRRHVRKGQIQRSRERAAAKRAETQEEERRKRKREQQLVEKEPNAGSSQPSSFESSTPKGEYRFPHMNDVRSQQPAGVRMLLSNPPRSPTSVMVPAFSPLRPSKRRNTRYC